MSKDKTPEVGDVWKDKYDKFVYIIKTYNNTSACGENYERTYKIIEFTGMENANTMECFRSDLIEYIGVAATKLKDLFEVQDEKD